jgi:hypothetical protein
MHRLGFQDYCMGLNDCVPWIKMTFLELCLQCNMDLSSNFDHFTTCAETNFCQSDKTFEVTFSTYLNTSNFQSSQAFTSGDSARGGDQRSVRCCRTQQDERFWV